MGSMSLQSYVQRQERTAKDCLEFAALRCQFSRRGLESGNKPRPSVQWQCGNTSVRLCELLPVPEQLHSEGWLHPAKSLQRHRQLEVSELGCQSVRSLGVRLEGSLKRHLKQITPPHPLGP